MKCVILAAGKGRRIRDITNSKPLLKIAGVPIIERIIKNCIDFGINEFFVVTGYNSKKIEIFLNLLQKKYNIKITNVYNEKWNELENGYSVLKVKSYLTEPFILLMSDHLFDKEILKLLTLKPLKEKEVRLAVDYNLNRSYIDFQDVTKVLTENYQIKNIGKNITHFNCFDTGIFYCSPYIFEILEKNLKKGLTTLSDAIFELSRENYATVINIGSYFWIDVDDKDKILWAENYIFKKKLKKSNDGFISKYINRTFSNLITKKICNYEITPNQISLISFLLSIIASLFFLNKTYLGLFLGGIFTQLSSIIDGCDGEIARLKFLETNYGKWFDAVLDRISDGFLIWCLTWHVFFNTNNKVYLWIGFLAILGSFMVSYTADKYDKMFSKKITFRIGRDIRLFMIFIGAILNIPKIILILLAFIMCLETFRRIIICKS